MRALRRRYPARDSVVALLQCSLMRGVVVLYGPLQVVQLAMGMKDETFAELLELVVGPDHVRR
jgi:hypothetical protein